MKKVLALFTLMLVVVMFVTTSESQDLTIRRGGVSVAAGTGVTTTTNGSVVTVNAVGGGLTNGYSFNTNQFTTVDTTNVHLANGFLFTNANAAGQVIHALGTSGAPAIAATNDTDTGIFFNGAGGVAVTADNGIRFVVYPGRVETQVGQYFSEGVMYDYETLSYVDATNVIVGVTNSGLFTLLITNNTYLSASNFPAAGKGSAFTVELLMDGTGGYTVGFDTNQWKFSSNNIPTISTNANAVSLLSCLTGSGATNVYVSPSLRHR